jgi:hypothetical protein
MSGLKLALHVARWMEGTPMTTWQQQQQHKLICHKYFQVTPQTSQAHQPH